LICIETADCVLFTRRAASVKLPQSAIAQKLCNWSRSRGAVMCGITEIDGVDEIYLLDE
jgi:hypothetical protein